MKKLLVAATISLFGLFSLSAVAGDFGDFLIKLQASRGTAIDMLLHKDHRGAAEQKNAKEKSDAARAAYAKLKAPAGKESQFKELQDLAVPFMDTRENEVIPRIVKGDDEGAKAILNGIQKERFGKISALVDVLGK